MEIWKDIEGYEGLYQVSNYGNVKSVERKIWNGKGYRISRERVLSPGNVCGYMYVGLSKNDIRKGYYIHRLVAEAFLPNPCNLPEVNHINEKPSDNNVSNLEWCTCEYNAIYSHGKRVLQLDKDSNEIIRKWDSLSQAKREGGFNDGYISSCCWGKRKLAYGFRWQFA